MARRQAGAVALAVLVAALLAAVSAKKPRVLLSSLNPPALNVTATPSEKALQAGKGTVDVTWGPGNGAQPAGAAKVLVELCYAPESRKDRGWRKAADDLSKDKACQFKLTEQAYDGAAGGSFEYRVARDIPSAFYFVRAYALDGSGKFVAYGQTNDAAGDFEVVGVTGITTPIKVAAGVFSAFSVVSLAFFFVVENRKKNK